MTMYTEPQIPQRVLQGYLERFRAIKNGPEIAKLHTRKWGKISRAKELIQEDALNDLTEAQAEELYRCLPISQRGRSVFLANPIKEVREALGFLLWEQLMYEMRVYEFLDQDWLKGADVSLAAALLCVKDPDLYGIISANTEKGFKHLKMYPKFDPKESQAGRFQKLQETLFLLFRMGEFQDLPEVDDFLEALSKGMLAPPQAS